ncbi:MAG TPA: glycosyltransferase family 4 protein [Nitrospiria bacterium]
MRVLLVNTFDIEGGAARAMYRLHVGLQDLGLDSKILAQIKSTGDANVVGPESYIKRGWALVRFVADGFPVLLYPKRERTNFYTAYLPDGLKQKCRSINPDVIHFHWLGGGGLRIETLPKLKKPLVWTLHDMWPFTGGCAYDGECGRYRGSCGCCPKLNSSRQKDLSSWIWNRKKKAWRNLNLTLVTPSKWLAGCARSSSLFNNYSIRVIPNGIDINRYKPIEKGVARNIIGLPQNKKLIMIGTLQALDEKRAGFSYMQSALVRLAKNGLSDQTEVVMVGCSKPQPAPNFGLKTYFVGRLNDDISMALFYSAADVFITSSLQENLPNMVVESISCGTPCVGFGVGGVSEIIEHRTTGYVAQAGDWEDLAFGIQWVLEDPLRLNQLGDNARKKAKHTYSIDHRARDYMSLYEEILLK